MQVNNSFFQLPVERFELDYLNKNKEKESDFITNMMLDPNKYRDFKRNINRINNIDNEIYYKRSLEKINTIDYVNSIKVSEEQYQKALQNSEILYQNLTEENIEDLLSHRKLLSKEKYLIETMNYFFGIDNFDWNTFKLSFNLYEAKTKMKSIDYNKIQKKRINIILGQICRTDKIDHFLNGNDFYDSGMKFVYEYVKTQLIIYFYLYQNKKLKKINPFNSSSDLIFKNNKNYAKLSRSKSQPQFEKFSKINSSLNNESTLNNTLITNKFKFNNNSIFDSKQSNILMTALPVISSNNNNYYIENEKKDKTFIPIEARRINFRLKDFNKDKERIIKEIRTAEMLPLLKHRTFRQMRQFFEISVPLSKKIEKQHNKEIKSFSLNNAQNSKRIISLIANGNIHILNYIPMKKIANVFGIDK